MKKYILPSLKMTLLLMLVCSLLYPLLIAGIGRLAPGGGDGQTVTVNGRVVGYALVGQKFDQDKYFWSRPSAAGFNAAGSSGSNKGPSNPDYLKDVQAHIDTFLAHNPGIGKQDIPAELVTYSGSGLDPDLSPEAAKIQVKRVARKRGLPEDSLYRLVDEQTSKPLLGFLGPSTVNVLKLNVALDKLNTDKMK
ncbi:MAG: K(+)-transporting ATPase subunit C [Bacteroidota bacterium]|nr:K(+)-transporting ATPase subunit C [Bacteroidota bacterium]MDP4216339.1 K(+)-transporting ATPase subunit C [Bacteroidota bacterium]MDP4246916.1 K(+)-transporting ATPase subunit C [Bacteroidota bacterium]MDP4254884.1 K(+)-transporting ATPase subunit C [Bacteroidota bacterium]MDP4257190.1 K(+)-transporting ATPase subunit C [Bacteroidota bacterium]